MNRAKKRNESSCTLVIGRRIFRDQPAGIFDRHEAAKGHSSRFNCTTSHAIDSTTIRNILPRLCERMDRSSLRVISCEPG